MNKLEETRSLETSSPRDKAKISLSYIYISQLVERDSQKRSGRFIVGGVQIELTCRRMERTDN